MIDLHSCGTNAHIMIIDVVLPHILNPVEW